MPRTRQGAFAKAPDASKRAKISSTDEPVAAASSQAPYGDAAEALAQKTGFYIFAKDPGTGEWKPAVDETPLDEAAIVTGDVTAATPGLAAAKKHVATVERAAKKKGMTYEQYCWEILTIDQANRLYMSEKKAGVTNRQPEGVHVVLVVSADEAEHDAVVAAVKRHASTNACMPLRVVQKRAASLVDDLRPGRAGEFTLVMDAPIHTLDDYLRRVAAMPTSTRVETWVASGSGVIVVSRASKRQKDGQSVDAFVEECWTAT